MLNKKIKIAIIGAGWFGCHIGYKLKQKNFNIKIFEKDKDIFNNASGNNTNRLHLGFHYPRCFKTREMSHTGYQKFIREYPNLSKNLKENIYAIDNPLNKLKQIQGVYFNWIGKEDREVGFIAQQVQRVLPEVVVEDKKSYLSVDYSKVVPLLVGAIQEQNDLIKGLQYRINKLEK